MLGRAAVVSPRLLLVSMKKGRPSTSDLQFGVVLLSRLGDLERRSCLYGLLVGRIRRNWMFARAQVQKGRSGRQTKSGASGSELLLAGKHVPDRMGESSRDVDLGDLGAALLFRAGAWFAGSARRRRRVLAH